MMNGQWIGVKNNLANRDRKLLIMNKRNESDYSNFNFRFSLAIKNPVIIISI
jgi:hypothetical protein